MNTLNILIKPWEQASHEAYAIRREVFIREQRVPQDMELDEYDLGAQHVLAYQGDQCIGTARLVQLNRESAQIGRMAVLKPFRSQGIGKAILCHLIELARSQNIFNLVLHSQVSAIPFYEQLGFQTEGPIYEEAGIPHRNMILLLSKTI